MDFTQPWEFGDATFVVEEKRIYANKTLLSMSSEVFKAMFNSEFKEKELTEIPLPDKKFDDFLQLMQVIHPQVKDSVNGANAYCILPLAHEFQIHHMVENCEKCLMTEPSIHNLILADKLSLPNLRKACIEYMTGVMYHQLVKAPGFNLLDCNTVLEVFHDKLKECDGKEISEKGCQDVIKMLESEAPSITNLRIAQRFDVHEVYKKCLDYAKNTPLSQLSRRDILHNSLGDLRPSTYVEILKSKVSQFNDVTNRVYSISDGKEYDTSQVCTNEGTSTAHSLGQASGTPPCPLCLHYNMDKIRKIVKVDI